MFKKFFSFLFEVLKIVLISLAIIVPVRYFLIQPFYVKGASMEPSFHDYEYLIVDEISYRFNEPERGEVVVFRYPRHPQEYFIKRIIALPGETVEVKNGLVYIYNEDNPRGFLLDEKYLPNGTQTYGLENEEMELKVDEYYVLGDNRSASKDSRIFGPVNKSFIIGKVWIRGWPIDKFEVFKYNINY
ncbi:MAG TPA: signal peptidase I [Patescibacteria group bacterium]|nr:signal peptidase I [Patescibacteria group bacterium]